MSLRHYNNLGIIAIEIAAVLSNCENLTISKALLISPIFSNKQLTQHLARKTTRVKSIEQLIAEKASFFSNFNNRYYDNLENSINAIQLLLSLEIVTINNNLLQLSNPLIYNSKMGKRAEKIYSASKNVASILEAESSILYLNLRIVL